MGNITYEPEFFQDCDCITVFGLCVGGMDGFSTASPNSSQLTNYGPTYGDNNTNLPFSSLDDEYYQTYSTGVANITTLTAERGSDASHRHRIDFDAESAHTYQMRTRAAFGPGSGGLTSQITITKNSEPKADKYIQPFIITEYLIKI